MEEPPHGQITLPVAALPGAGAFEKVCPGRSSLERSGAGWPSPTALSAAATKLKERVT
jgi:hypothetical protein